MKRTKKLVKILAIIFLIILIFQNNLYAATIDTDIEIGKTNSINASNDMISKFTGIFQVVGSVVSILALVIIGIRYMFSSLEERAQLKGILIYYLVGAILVFGTSNLLSIVYNIIKEIK